jgi:hypothetical protein
MMNYANIRFFCLLLSTIKCSRVPFTHICEWKRHSPSLGSSASFDWIILVVTVTMGSTSMICFLLSLSKSDSKLGLEFVSLRSTTNDCFERHSLVLCQGILWKSHHFLVSFFIFTLPLFSCGMEWLS